MMIPYFAKRFKPPLRGKRGRPAGRGARVCGSVPRAIVSVGSRSVPAGSGTECPFGNCYN
ncbi:MAG: hypothetical protein LIO54_02720 [Oscillospiraceae bacterium]|nr:hypothetical protein [Oscillospiraceae bacterium]